MSRRTRRCGRDRWWRPTRWRFTCGSSCGRRTGVIYGRTPDAGWQRCDSVHVVVPVRSPISSGCCAARIPWLLWPARRLRRGLLPSWGSKCSTFRSSRPSRTITCTCRCSASRWPSRGWCRCDRTCTSSRLPVQSCWHRDRLGQPDRSLAQQRIALRAGTRGESERRLRPRGPRHATRRRRTSAPRSCSSRPPSSSPTSHTGHASLARRPARRPLRRRDQPR